MAEGEKIEAHNNGGSGISNDGVDGIPDRGNGKDSASNMGSIQYIGDLKSKEKR